MLNEDETFVPTQTPTGMFVGEIIARLSEITDEEDKLCQEAIKLMNEAEEI